MSIIVGGLLVFSLFSQPVVVDFTYVAFDLFQKENRLEYASPDTLADQYIARDIDEILQSMEENTREITELLKEKNKVMQRISTTMDARSQAGIGLSETQMDQYAGFIAFSDARQEAVKQSLFKIDAQKDLTLVKHELLQDDADYALVYNELKALTEYQDKTIGSLQEIISQGINVLDQLAC